MALAQEQTGAGGRPLGRQLLRDLDERPSGQQSMRTALAQGFSVERREPIVTIYGSAPQLRFIETDQVRPIGEWRWRLLDDAYSLERSLTSGFATVQTYFVATATNVALYSPLTTGVAILRGASGSSNAAIQVSGNAHATLPGAIEIITAPTSSTTIRKVFFDRLAADAMLMENIGGIEWGTLGTPRWFNNTATGNAIVEAMVVAHNTTGTPADGIGVRLTLAVESTTTTFRDAGYIDTSWVTAADLTRASRMSLSVLSVAVVLECIRMESIATAAGLGFYGVAAVARAAAISAPTGGATVDAEARTAINSIRTALTNIGVTS